MQPDHEADELQDLLRNEYDAPRLDEPFSAEVISRLQSEVSSLRSLLPVKPRRLRQVVGLVVATVASLMVAVVWITNSEFRANNREVSRGVDTTSNRLAQTDFNRLADDSEIESVDRMPDRLSSATLSSRVESKSMDISESTSLREKVQSELARSEARILDEEKPRTLSTFAILDQKEWPNVSATAVLADLLYVVDSGRLYEIRLGKGVRRAVDEADWRNTVAMGAVGGHLYLVCDNQLYDVNPETGVRRGLGKPTWKNTKAIVTVAEKLYIFSNGLLLIVNPADGSFEVLHVQNDLKNNPH